MENNTSNSIESITKAIDSMNISEEMKAKLVMDAINKMTSINSQNGNDNNENEKVPDWKRHMKVDAKNKIENSVENYTTYFTEHPKYAGKLKFNEYTQQKEFGNREWDADFDLDIACNDIERDCKIRSKEKVTATINEIFVNNSFNPVIDYLKGLKWDGKERCANLFIDLLEADDTELNRVMAMKWFMAAVKRQLEPGCKFDNIIVLQGGQGIGKSTICELLANGFFSTISLNEIGNKDLVEKLNRTWIAIVDELDTFNKKEMSTIKSFIAESENTVRLAYGRGAKKYKRHCIFIGSTNDDTFLRDSTSSVERRFWVIKCNKTTMDGRVRQEMKEGGKYEVDQLWAEAYHKLMQDYTQYLDLESQYQKDFAEEMVQFKTYTDDPVIDYVRDILDRDYSFEVIGEKSTGEFVDCNDFLRQAKGDTIHTGLKEKINKIPMSALHFVLKDIYKEDRNSKYIALAISNEWDYKTIKYKGKSIRGLYRKNQIVSEVKTEDNSLPF